MDRGTRAALLVVAGLVLLANGAWLYPGDVTYDHRYTVTTTDRADLDVTPRVAACDLRPLGSRTCVVANHLADGGVLRYTPERPDALADDGEGTGDEDDTGWLTSRFDYVVTYGQAYHRPTARVVNGTVRLRLDRVSRERVLRAVSADVDAVPPYVATAVREGETTHVTASRLEGRSYLVESAEGFHTVRVRPSGRVPAGWGWRAPPGWVVDLLRLAGWLGGAGLLVRAGRVAG
jgi:hypothetical protein